MKQTVEIVHIVFLSEQERTSVLLGNSPKKTDTYKEISKIENLILQEIAGKKNLELIRSEKRFRSTRWELRVLAQKTLSEKEENQFWENIEKNISQMENKLNRVFEKMDDFFKEVFKKTGDKDGDGEKKQ